MRKINNTIKLIVWDMDETFWKGTISESDVSVSMSNISLIRQLVDRGIMNAISSKNDYEVVKKKLQELGVWDYFVFPKINWKPKAAQIKQTIEECRLRPTNVLFIDDNPHNLGEAKILMPELNVAEPEVIPSLLALDFLKGNDDREHKRLKQFKVLEQKQQAISQCASNDEFLRQSNIKVEIHHDCEKQKERLLDLINRSNQLNYTKVRLTAEQFDTLLSNTTVKNCYVTVKDNYGDYGIVGFASIKDSTAQHFLFSCRTIGMGVEQYVYAQLGFPELTVVGNVIAMVKPDYCPDWINTQEQLTETQQQDSDVSVLLRGGCDLRQMEPYLHFHNFKAEYNYADYHRDHSVMLLNAYHQYPELEEIKKKCPLLWHDCFDTEMFSGKYDVVVWSVLMDYTQGLYRYKKNPAIRIVYYNFDHPITPDFTLHFKKEELQWFFENFEFVGRISPAEFMQNLQFIRTHIGKKTKLIIINGCEVNHENPEEPNRYLIHQEMNAAVDKFLNPPPPPIHTVLCS